MAAASKLLALKVAKPVGFKVLLKTCKAEYV
jgi:hypothetical protein